MEFARVGSPDAGKKRHTPRAIIEQMNDISGTITELMHENVYLRTKLLNAKSPFWKRLFVGSYDVDSIFMQWAIQTKQSQKVSLIEEYKQETARIEREMQDLLRRTKEDFDQKLQVADDKLEDANSKIEEQASKIESQLGQIGRFMKYISVVDENIRDAKSEHLDITESDLAEARSKYQILANPTNVQDEETSVNEYIVESLHSLLSQVDGRYVRPLNTNLHKRTQQGPKSNLNYDSSTLISVKTPVGHGPAVSSRPAPLPSAPPSNLNNMSLKPMTIGWGPGNFSSKVLNGPGGSTTGATPLLGTRQIGSGQ